MKPGSLVKCIDAANQRDLLVEDNVYIFKKDYTHNHYLGWFEGIDEPLKKSRFQLIDEEPLFTHETLRGTKWDCSKLSEDERSELQEAWFKFGFSWNGFTQQPNFLNCPFLFVRKEKGHLGYMRESSAASFVCDPYKECDPQEFLDWVREIDLSEAVQNSAENSTNYTDSKTRLNHGIDRSLVIGRFKDLEELREVWQFLKDSGECVATVDDRRIQTCNISELPSEVSYHEGIWFAYFGDYPTTKIAPQEFLNRYRGLGQLNQKEDTPPAPLGLNECNCPSLFHNSFSNRDNGHQTSCPNYRVNQVHELAASVGYPLKQPKVCSYMTKSDEEK